MADLDVEFERACAAFDGDNFERLLERDQVLVTIWGLEADVNNGGFDQYFFNGAGDLAFFAPTALRKIGAARMADIVERANAFFGTEGPPRVREVRQNKLFELTEDNEDLFDGLDQEFYKYPDDIAQLLAFYLSAN